MIEKDIFVEKREDVRERWRRKKKVYLSKKGKVKGEEKSIFVEERKGERGRKKVYLSRKGKVQWNCGGGWGRRIGFGGGLKGKVREMLIRRNWRKC